MLEIVLILLLINAIIVIFERSVVRIVIYMGVFSLLSTFAYVLMGSPDVAMAEAVVSAFSTILMIVCIEKYYAKRTYLEGERPRYRNVLAIVKRFIAPLIFSGLLFGIFIYFMPEVSPSTYLRDLYLYRFRTDVGGENAVASIVLAFRVYDTLFEALILIIAVVAVGHMSWYSKEYVDESQGKKSQIERSSIAIFAMRIVAPLILVFGVYLMLNGHISAGGGFQGGVVVAAFFVCRYMVYNIYDIPIKKVMKFEELVFINIVVIAVISIFIGFTNFMPTEYTPFLQELYLIAINTLIGIKVACGFFLLFYRYIAIEKME